MSEKSNEEKILEINKKNQIFWNSEFSKKEFEEYEWFLGYEHLKTELCKLIKKSDKILQIGRIKY